MEEKWVLPLERNNELQCNARAGSTSDRFASLPYKSVGFSVPLCCWCRELHCDALSDKPSVLTYHDGSDPRFQCREMMVSGAWRKLHPPVYQDMQYTVRKGYNASDSRQTVVHFKKSTTEVVKLGFIYDSKKYSDATSLKTFDNSFASGLTYPKTAFSTTYRETRPVFKKDGESIWQWVWSVSTQGIGQTDVLCFTVQAKKIPKCFPGFANDDKTRKKWKPYKQYQTCTLPPN